MQSLFEKAEAIFTKHERRISSLALIGGFVFDSLTLRRIDLLFENLTILTYLVISGGSIILINYFEEYPSEKSLGLKLKSFLPFFIQFAFGALFSAFFIFYIRSANFLSSWPFILVLLFLLVGNEFFRSYYERFVFQVSIYFTALFSFLIFFLPVVTKSMGPLIVVLSGAVSLLLISLFLLGVRRMVPNKFSMSKRSLAHSILSIFIVINILYFANLIPPIPLALKESGVYYSIQRVGNDYYALGNKTRWYDPLLFLTDTIALRDGDDLYVFSSVFAPTNLNTKIVHHWQYFDQSIDEWKTSTKISFPIRGGRDNGYRGFSRKESLAPGRWRVNVETERGQVVGRVRFNIENSPTMPILVEKVL